MNTRINALVVEDDLEIQGQIEDVLATLGHDHDWAQSQQEAREFIESRDYDYVLADLEIPARPGRGFPKIEYGHKLIEQIQQIKGRGTLPVVVMTAHHRQGFNLVTQLLGNGVMDFIAKRFDDSTAGRSLTQVIQGVLEKHRRHFPPGVLPGDPPEEFRGGVLGYYPDHVELEGEIILESGGPGHSWPVMQALRQRRPNGKLPRMSAPKLALAMDPKGRLSDNAVASCVHDLRGKITHIMLAKANILVGREDVIANGGQGYHIADWLVIEEHDTESVAQANPAPAPAPEPERGPVQAPPTGDVLLTERQHWILDQLRGGGVVTRAMVQTQFEIGDRQAKRELAGLTTSGLVRFVRKPRPGHYALRVKGDLKVGEGLRI